MGDGKHRQLAMAGTAREYWRGLAEIAGVGPDAAAEFPEGADLPPDVSRRTWMKLVGASMALAGVSGCSRMRGEKILPYTRTPPNVTPGVPRLYATSLVLDGFATGVLVESWDGRPTKVEGNPDHPASLGASSMFDQAAVLDLYDEARAREMRAPGGAPTWDAMVARFGGERADGGAGLRFLLEPTGSLLVRDLVERVRERFPAARFTFHGAASAREPGEGARLAFGAPIQPCYDFAKADVVLSLDADFLGSGPFSIPWARAWAERRRPASPAAEMSRLYVVETMFSPTGSMADHRLRRRPSEVAPMAARIAAQIAAGPGGARIPAVVATALKRFSIGLADPTLQAIARDLSLHAGRSVVIVGPRQPAIVHALGHVMNVMLGNLDTAWGIDPTLIGAGGAEQDLAALARELDGGAVDTLVILEGNPVFTAPPDLDLARRIGRVKDVLYLGASEDETARAAGWFVPAAHALESWGDARAYDGTVSFVQPLVRPFGPVRTATEVLSVFAGDRDLDAHELLRKSWLQRETGPDLPARWEQALRTGVVAGSASPRRHPELSAGPLFAAHAAMPLFGAGPRGIEVSFAPDPGIHDGRFANNGWLLEVPRPFTHLTWDNAVLLSPATAARLKVGDEDVVELDLGGRAARAPVLVVAGHADEAVTLHLGWGRRLGAPLSHGVGFDANALRTSRELWSASDLVIRKREGERYLLARTQLHWTTAGRPIALAATIEEYRKDPKLTAELRGDQPSVLPAVPMEGEQWAMTIDTSICTGCSACVVACQAENNILVVGKDEVARSREMHWLRIDSYHHGDPESPLVVNEPMLCQHCERAPCEYVCPVNATVHSPDGLNEMAYNRCVGTRFCSNNCPYKVRRFNWYDWNTVDANRGSVMLQRNPDVTVRQRGVMEKCTYCVQRIREADIHARVENRSIRPGEVVTACQEACPTQAIQFGSLHHEETRMVKWRNELRRFDVLHELGTNPRTAYLARIDNPNPEIR